MKWWEKPLPCLMGMHSGPRVHESPAIDALTLFRIDPGWTLPHYLSIAVCAAGCGHVFDRCHWTNVGGELVDCGCEEGARELQMMARA